MVVTIIVLALIVFYTSYVIYSVLHKYIKAKKAGTSVGCYSCSSFNSGSCSHNCTTKEEVDEMIQKAKETLKAKQTATEDAKQN